MKLLSDNNYLKMFMNSYSTMKYVSLIGSIILLTSCEPLKEESIENSPVVNEGKQKFSELKEKEFAIIVIEDCEYIVYSMDFTHGSKGYGFMAHKGNCKNPIHVITLNEFNSNEAKK